MHRSLAIVVIAFVVGGIFVWGLQRLPTRPRLRFAEIKTTLLTIPTPEEWYAWGLDTFPSGVTPPTSASVTFGNKPLDNKQDNFRSSIIIVGGYGIGNQTPDEWVAYHYWGTMPSLFSATSTGKTWSVENGNLIFGSLDEVQPDPPVPGIYVLSYYVFNRGIAYTFTSGIGLDSYESGHDTHIKADVANSPEAEIMRTMVKHFADSLPSLVGATK